MVGRVPGLLAATLVGASGSAAGQAFLEGAPATRGAVSPRQPPVSARQPPSAEHTADPVEPALASVGAFRASVSALAVGGAVGAVGAVLCQQRAQRKGRGGGGAAVAAAAAARAPRAEVVSLSAPAAFSLAGGSRAMFGALGATWRPSAEAVGGRAAVLARRAMMFERFTEKTIKAVMLAQAEARRLSRDLVGLEMITVGVLAEGSDIGYLALVRLGMRLPEARSTLEEVVGFGAGGKALEIPFTAEAKRVLEDSIECAREAGSPSVSTAHLLRAIIREATAKGLILLQKVLMIDSLDAVGEMVAQALVQEESAAAMAGGRAEAGGRGGGRSAAHVAGRDGEVNLEETLKYSQDLTALAKEGKLDPLVGRADELKRTIRILGRRSKNNPVLLGEAGVGKTTIAHGLAQRIAEGNVPMTLRDKRVIQLDMALLLAGTRYRGDFEERLKAIVKEVGESNRRVILVIDEVHTLVGAGSSGGPEGGGIDAANLLKPALARGELQCIGATTLDEYRKYIEKDPALERRFQPVFVPEPTQEETVKILEGLAPKYEQHHQLRYQPEALVAAVKLASQYIADRYLPDKAIDVMDEAGSKVRQQLFQEFESAELIGARFAITQELEDVRKQKKAAVAAEKYDEAQRLKNREMELAAELAASAKVGPDGQGGGAEMQQLLQKLRSTRAQVLEAVSEERFGDAQALKEQEGEIVGQLAALGGGSGVSPSALVNRMVTAQDVEQVVAGWTGIAVEQVSASESTRLLSLEMELHRSIIGQNEAVQSVSRALRRARAGLRNPVRPIAGFMFCGPTGVGKTELCKTLAATFFGTAQSMIRLDMSEYMEKHTVSKLVGAPPGYVGYSDGGTLTEAVRRRPYSVVLFDEVEKAHPDVFNMMLQVLDDGRLTDSKGRTVSFANTLIIMTSNLGSRSVQKGTSGGGGLGFVTAGDEDDTDYSRMKDLVNEEMKGFFRPEFLNRLDEIVVFRSLTRENIRAIAEVEFKKVIARLGERQLDVTLTDRFKERVLEEGFDPAYGARPLRRAITRLLEDTLAEHVLGGTQEEAPQGRAQVRQFVELDVSRDGRVVVHRGRPILEGSGV